ncbi:MAG: hypothetical protein LBF78_09045 [Treponema sp.]|jgi:hypothetical protein|nr:hypothetical protein [Treponema sp.]
MTEKVISGMAGVFIRKTGFIPRFFAHSAVGLPVAMLAAVLFSACLGTNMSSYRMELTPDAPARSRLLKLRNGTLDILGGASLGTDLYQQAENLIQAGFSDSEGEDYGYYCIYFHNTQSMEMKWLFINAFTVFIPSFFGAPYTEDAYGLTAFLFVFASNGDLIKAEMKQDVFTNTQGLYYGHHPERIADIRYSEMFSGMVQEMENHSEEINRELLIRGPVTDDKAAAARAKIARLMITLKNTLPRELKGLIDVEDIFGPVLINTERGGIK